MYRTIKETYANVKAYNNASDELETLGKVHVGGTAKKPVYEVPEGYTVVKVLDTYEVGGKAYMSDTRFLWFGEDRGEEGIAGPGYYGCQLYAVPVTLWLLDKSNVTVHTIKGTIAGSSLDPGADGYTETGEARYIKRACFELWKLMDIFDWCKLVSVDLDREKGRKTYVRMRRDAFIENALDQMPCGY